MIHLERVLNLKRQTGRQDRAMWILEVSELRETRKNLNLKVPNLSIVSGSVALSSIIKEKRKQILISCWKEKINQLEINIDSWMELFPLLPAT